MANVITLSFLTAVLTGMIPRAIPILSSAMGEVVSQNAGVLNLGIEGYMLMGATSAFVTDFVTGSIALAFLIGGLVGMVFALFHAITSITLKADQAVSGTAIWLVGWGLSGVLYRAWFGFYTISPTVDVLRPIVIPYLTSIPILGQALFGQDIAAYLIIGMVVLVHFFLYHTKAGLNLRTVGEDPRVAEIAGVNPIKYRYAAVLFSGFMSGIGGAYLILAVVGSYFPDITAGIGFIAVAMVYFGKWKPARTFLGSLIFGAVYIVYLSVESFYASTPYQFFAIWPYLAALVLIVTVGAKSRPPAALTKPYVKEG